jgi:hypothetical protein
MFAFPDVTIDGSAVELSGCIHENAPLPPDGDDLKEEAKDGENGKQLGTPEYPVLKCSAAVKMRTAPNSKEKRLPASDRLTDMPPDFCLDEKEKAIYTPVDTSVFGQSEAEAMVVPL